MSRPGRLQTWHSSLYWVVAGVELRVGVAGGRALVRMVNGTADGRDVFGGSVGVRALHAR